ncbi:MAG: BlaI/MecI/CopY family transcriptional regulator [Lachnospiraceae bacterium]|nr:BlaI/MecI/CopY family transcriptional regulator [Lachnospiraceae bacterium]
MARRKKVQDGRMSDKEYLLLSYIWELEPVYPSVVARRCEEEVAWKKSTSYTMIKIVREKGFITSEDGKVVSLISKEDYDQVETDFLIGRNFGGSMKSFLAAYLAHHELGEKEAKELVRMIRADQKERRGADAE